MELIIKLREGMAADRIAEVMEMFCQHADVVQVTVMRKRRKLKVDEEWVRKDD